MRRRQWFYVAGTVMLAACHGPTDTCVNAAVSAGAHFNRDEVALVECPQPPTVPSPEAPAPKVDSE